MKNKNHTLCCYRYCNRVYNINQQIEQIKDGRVAPSIKLPQIFLTVIFSLMAGLHSFESMEEAIKDGDFDKFFNFANLPSADTIFNTFMVVDLDHLRNMAVFIITKARYNKFLNSNTIDGLKVVAIDGTHVFTMTSERLGKEAHRYEHKNDNGEITSGEFRELAVGASYVGKGFSPILKINRIPKGEVQICYFVTTMEKSQLKAFTVWKIAHRRWSLVKNILGC
jgi:hypothetical protein